MEIKKRLMARMNQAKLDKNFDIGIHPETQTNGLPVTYPLHWHEYYEIEILLAGNETEYVGDKILHKNRGHFSILSPSVCHSVELDGDAQLVNIRLRERFFNGYEDIKNMIELPGGSISGVLPENEFEDVIGVAEIVRRDFERTQLLSDADKSLMIYILLKLLGNREASEQTKPIDKLFSDVLFHINHHFTEKITVESVAKHFGFASNYFGKKFCAQAGVPFNEYINNIRLNYGYSLVVENEQSIDEIAVACGFGDRTYFTTLFRKKFGMTPTECRKKHADRYSGTDCYDGLQETDGGQTAEAWYYETK